MTEVLNYLRDRHKIAIQIDSKSLEEAGVGTDLPVTADLKGVNLRSALRHVFKKLNLTYVIKGGILLVTTPEEADNLLETRVYPVADLVLPEGASGEDEADFDSLIDLITSTIKPTSWDEAGGPGSVMPFENRMSIVLSQTQDVHEELEDLLAQLRRIKRQQGGGLPFAKRARKKTEGGGGMMGGMGGGMGGTMGGAPAALGGGTFGGRPANAPQFVPNRSIVVHGQTQPGDADLLQGVRGANQSNQNRQSGKLQQMYNKGKGGVNAGAAF